MIKTIQLTQHEGLIYAEHYDENGTHIQTIATAYIAKKAKSHAYQCKIENEILALNPGVQIIGSYNAPTIF